MAKKQPKDLDTLKQEAKTFHDLVAVIADDHKQAVRRLHSSLKKGGLRKAYREGHEEALRERESQLRSLEARHQRYESNQADKKIPAAVRKKIAELETVILRREGSYDWRGFVRYRKKELAELFEQVDRIRNPPKSLTTTNKAFRVGKDYPGQSITRTYDGYVWEVLKGHFERLPRAKGQRTTFKIVAALPEKAEYLQLKERHFTQTLDALVDDAYGIVEELHEELQEAYENMPWALQGGPVGEARQEAATELETISGDQPELPDFLASVRLVHYPPLHQTSRHDRAGGAADMLQAAVKAVEDYRKSGVKLKKADAKALDEFAAQLEDHATQIGDVDFPGMFG